MADGTEQQQTAQALQPSIVTSHDVITGSRSESSPRSTTKCSVVDVMDPASVDSGQQLFTELKREHQRQSTTPTKKTSVVISPTPTNVAQNYLKVIDGEAAEYSSPAPHVRLLVGQDQAAIGVAYSSVTGTAKQAGTINYGLEQEMRRCITAAT